MRASVMARRFRPDVQRAVRVSAMLMCLVAVAGAESGAAAHEPDGVAASDNSLRRFEFREQAMGVDFKIALYACSFEVANNAATVAFARIHELDGRMSDYVATSEVRQMCDQALPGKPVQVSEDLFRVLSVGQQLARDSGGAFDMTVGQLTKLWRRAHRQEEMPPADKLEEALGLTGHQFVRLDPETRSVELLKSGVRIDLGGIAKGYATDEALKTLARHGITRALVDGSGDIAVGEPPPGADGWTVSIAGLDPDGKSEGRLRLANAAVATSGDAYQFVEIDGRRFSHIVNPKTGLGVERRSSVTVIARSGMDADALASAITVLGADRMAALLDQPAWRGADALVLTGTGERDVMRSATPGFQRFVAAVAEDAEEAVPVDPNVEPIKRPNIMVVLADDLGYGDLACYGHPRIQSPHLDEFARNGLKLTDCYAAAPNCSPSRTGLMTGRTPFRVGIYNWIPMFSPMHVRRSEITIATLLRNAGYATCHAGKWHLNGDFNLPSQPQPWDHGFSHWFSTQNNALPNHRNPFNFVRNGRAVGPLEGYAADLVADEAIGWLERHCASGGGEDSSSRFAKTSRLEQQPFFMFVCFHEPHEPIASAENYSKLYPSDDPSLSAHHGNVTQMDAAFGRLIAALDRLNVRDNTLVVFTSDNGPAITAMHPHGSAGPLRDKKGALYDGGIRVPGLVQWPGKIEPGSVSSEPVGGVDLLPTLCAVAGIAPPADRRLDGTNLLPLLGGDGINDEKSSRTRPLYWQFHRAHGGKHVAIRNGRWKLLAAMTTTPPRPSGEIAAGEIDAIKTSDLTEFELYDLQSDVGENRDVKDMHPEVLARMRETLESMFRDVQEEAPPWPAWEWPRYEASKIVWPEYWTNRKARSDK